MAQKILIVDDSASVRLQVKFALSPGDFEVIEAENGSDALEKLQLHPAIRLALCDVNMPGMGGLELLDAIRADPTLSHLPVIMLTNEAHPAVIQHAKDAGAKGWIIKPFKPPLLLATVVKMTGSA